MSGQLYILVAPNGCLAQLVERRHHTADVGGSNPSAPTISSQPNRLITPPSAQVYNRGLFSYIYADNGTGLAFEVLNYRVD